MQVEIVKGPGSSAANITLAKGEGCVSEGGAMIALRGAISLETSTKTKGGGGILSGLKRVVAGESFFINRYTAGADGDQVMLASTLPGDMTVIDLRGLKIIAESGSFVTAASSVDMKLGWQGVKSLLSGEGLFWLHLEGEGAVVLSAFGALYTIDVNGEYIVDSGHIVAFEESLDFSISKAGGSWLGSFLGGEGFVCRFRGQGRIWCQSHQSRGFGRSLTPMLRAR